jgi:acetyltransferase-like isoleucine patch superfamily enzyme
MRAASRRGDFLYSTPEMRLAAYLRVAWTVATIFVVESVVLGVAVLPAFVFWTWSLEWALPERTGARVVVVAMSFVPAYLVFAVALVVLSAASTKVFGWRTRRDAAWSLRDLEWGLLDWVRYMISTHVVRVLVGTFFRSSPLWTWYLRLNGARVGRGVFINSLAISDHNLLEFGDQVVIGEAVHLSGHTVERGLVKTGRVCLGEGVTVGLGSMVGIGVVAGPRCQIGALSVVPKFATLDGDAVYAGVPVRKLERATPAALEI